MACARPQPRARPTLIWHVYPQCPKCQLAPIARTATRTHSSRPHPTHLHRPPTPPLPHPSLFARRAWQRLGHQGVHAIKEAAFFASIDWRCRPNDLMT
eukprot:5273731-Prymnesium_polylepis.1